MDTSAQLRLPSWIRSALARARLVVLSLHSVSSTKWWHTIPLYFFFSKLYHIDRDGLVLVDEVHHSALCRYVSERWRNARQIPDHPLHHHHSQHHLPSCTQRSCTKAWSLSNSTSNLYKTKWHRSQCCGQKCTRIRCAQVKIVRGSLLKKGAADLDLLLYTKVPLTLKKHEEIISARSWSKHGGMELHTLVTSSYERQIAQL